MTETQSRLKRTFGLLAPHWKTAAVILNLTLVAAGLNSVEPLIQKFVFDKLAENFDATRPANIENFLLMAVGALIALLLVKELVGIITNVLYWRLQLTTKYNLLDKAVARIYNLSLGYHQNETIGALMTRLDRGINGFSDSLFNISFNLLPSLLYLICTIVAMFSLSWKLSLVALLFAPLPAVIGFFSARVSSRREKSLLERWTKIYARFQETLNLVKTIKSFNMHNSERLRFLNGVGGANEEVARGVKVDSYFGSGKNLAMGLGRIAVLGVGALLISRGEVTVGTLVAFISYTGGLYAPMIGLAGFYEAFRKAKVYLDTIFDIIDTPDAIKDHPHAIELKDVQGAVAFESVKFGYDEKRPILKGVDFTVSPGSLVALVGPSGSGKTTIVDLISRFYDPQSGRITIDGYDLRDVSQHSLRESIGMVLQDTILFHDTIANNIACARPDASREEVIAAARAANVMSFVDKLPDGLETVVGERGSKLSGGERQRVAIARAILKNPRIYIFDEASSNLDAESEALIQQSIEKLSLGKTVFIIAHRLATVQRADLILVVSDGQIAERGKHQELMHAGGIYRQLVEKQQITGAIQS